MEPILVSTQAEYDEARNIYQNTLDTSHFDLDADKGMEIVEEVDYHIHNYLCRNVTKEETENSLSRCFFTECQAQEITGYFFTRKPKDLYDIERGLNALGLPANVELYTSAPRIHIKDARETISVQYPVEVFGRSQVEAFGHAKVIAHDAARITAHDRSLVELLDSARLTAFDRSRCTAMNSSKVVLNNHATALAYNFSSVTARHHARLSLFDNAGAEVSDNVIADVYNNVLVTSEDHSTITAFHDSNVAAYGNSLVTAKDESNISAYNSVTVHAEDNSVTMAYDTAKVTADHQAIVFTRDDMECTYTDKVRVIKSWQNKPQFLKRNALALLDHPYINGEPVTAINLLIRAADPDDKEEFSRQLNKMGCVDGPSTDKILHSLKNEADRARRERRSQNNSWER
jgi:hypothetical protein